MSAADNAMSVGAVLAVLILLALVFGVPAYFILKRAGLNPALAAFGLVPLLGPFILLSILAFKEWPNEPGGYR